MLCTFSIRLFDLLIIVILNSLPDNSNIYVILESSSDACSSDCICLLWGISCNFLLKARHIALGNKNWDTLAFGIRIYVKLARSCAVFVSSSCRSQKLQIPLISLFCLLSWLWAFLITYQSLHLAALSAVSHCYFTGALLMWWYDQGGEVFYNLMIKVLSFNETVSPGYDLHTRFSIGIAFTPSQVRKPGGGWGGSNTLPPT